MSSQAQPSFRRRDVVAECDSTRFEFCFAIIKRNDLAKLVIAIVIQVLDVERVIAR